jgi:hypothetical protein
MIAALVLAGVGAAAGWLAPPGLAGGMSMRRRVALGAVGGALGGLAIRALLPLLGAAAGAIAGALLVMWLAARVYPAGPR